MRIALICDSTADLTDAERDALNVSMVPLNIHFGTEVLRDHVDISPAQFLDRLASTTEMPRTSQPSPAIFTHAFQTAAESHDAVLALTISSKLSGTHQSAILGAESANLSVPVRVVDSLSASIGLGMQVRRARELITSGRPLEQVVQTLELERDRYHLIFFADTLEFLQRGGRIGKAGHLLGSLLKIKPLLLVDGGEVHPYERTRSRARAIEGLIEYAHQFHAVERMAILHDGTTQADVDTITNGVSDFLSVSAITVSHYGPIIASHVGPGALGLCVFEGA